MEDNKGRSYYRCRYCGFKTRLIDRIKAHLFTCKFQDHSQKVTCCLCNFHGKNLGIHLSKVHNISSKEYLKQYPYANILSSKSFVKYSASAYKNSWLKQAISDGYDLTDYWNKVSKGVSESILSNNLELKRRSCLMTRLNNEVFIHEKFRKIMSETAKKTSARPDIIHKRTQQLKNWRDTHPEEFYEKCTKKMLSTWHSKPELELYEIVSKWEGFSFKRNQTVKSNNFINKSKRKQVDIADKKKRIYIEFDGIHHFKNIYNNLIEFEKKQKMDLLLNNHILLHNWLLIRVSYNVYSYKDGFDSDILFKIKSILQSKQKGVFKFGDAYGKY